MYQGLSNPLWTRNVHFVYNRNKRSARLIIWCVILLALHLCSPRPESCWQNEFRPNPHSHRRFWKIPEDLVHLDLFATDPSRLPHDGERLHWGHAAPSVLGGPQVRGRQPDMEPTDPEPQPPGLLLLLLGEPDRTSPVQPWMGLQLRDLPEHHCH